MIDFLTLPAAKLFGNRFKKRVSGGDFKHPFCANKHSKFCDYASFLLAQGMQDYISSKGELKKTRIIRSSRGYLVKFELTTLPYCLALAVSNIL